MSEGELIDSVENAVLQNSTIICLESKMCPPDQTLLFGKRRFLETFMKQ